MYNRDVDPALEDAVVCPACRGWQVDDMGLDCETCQATGVVDMLTARRWRDEHYPKEPTI